MQTDFSTKGLLKTLNFVTKTNKKVDNAGFQRHIGVNSALIS